MNEETTGCPSCGFADYAAKSVYGMKAYRYEKTQEPWKEKKLAVYEALLEAVIIQNVERDKRK